MTHIYANLKVACLAVQRKVDIKVVSAQCEAGLAPPDLDRMLAGDQHLKEFSPHIAKRYATYVCAVWGSSSARTHRPWHANARTLPPAPHPRYTRGPWA